MELSISIIPKSKKAQIWGMDLMFGVIIILVGIIGIYFYSINLFGNSETSLNEMDYDANFVSSQILSEGYPIDWTNEDVKVPGILTENKVNQTKLDRIYNFSQNDYEELRQILGTTYNFYFNFSDLEITDIGNIAGIGKEINNPENLIKLERYTIYKDKITRLDIYIWK